MFRELKAVVTAPTADHPAARIWRRSDLRSVVARVRNQHTRDLKTTFPSAGEVIDRMLAIGWLLPMKLEGVGSRDPAPVYLVDMEAMPEDLPEPWELLQGFSPAGVLCYFGALAFHELTTQQPAFHHIASLEGRPTGHAADAELPAKSSGQQRPKRDPLGQLEFLYQGVPCYTTRRDRMLVPGVQSRDCGPRIRVRITTLEQTLLDTLLQPQRCGGESIVFEAWERGVRKWNPDRIAKHLEAISRQDLCRRVGAMLGFLGEALPQGPLAAVLASAREKLVSDPTASTLPLLPGLASSHSFPEWGIGPT